MSLPGILAPDPALKHSARLPRAWRDPAGCPHTLTGPGASALASVKTQQSTYQQWQALRLGQLGGIWVLYSQLCNFGQAILHLCASSFSSREWG